MKTILLALIATVIINTSARADVFVVAKDGTGTHTNVQSAVDACPVNVRSYIFIKNGVYDEYVSIGTKTVASQQLISFMGQNKDSVIITSSKSLSQVSSFELATTVKVYAKDFYAENITFQNTAGNTGQALALYNASDKYVLKNCNLYGYQDTYRTKKGTRGYLTNCKISGATDFIYAGGIVFFDDCEIVCVNGGGYICAPEDAFVTIPKAQTKIDKFLRLGFILRNCNIVAGEGTADNSFYLGRPWNSYCGAFYLNCKMGSHIKAAGWTEMGGNLVNACFAEYNSMNPDGSPKDVSSRVSPSFQLLKEDVDNLLYPDTVYARVSTVKFEPLKMIEEHLNVTGLPQLNQEMKIIKKGHLLQMDEKANCRIINLDGKIVYQSNSFDNEVKIPSNIRGIYLIQLKNEKGISHYQKLLL